ncbi:MAG: LPP20 family lipoprotein [Nitrospirae bacterium]|nr:LPP20 family lipoprotein [Nitrospirota bacterium]
MNIRRCCISWTVLIWIVFGTLPAPVTSAQKPDWVEGKSLSYPEDRYLTGVGYGEDRKSAEESAYGAIARIFQAEIGTRTEEWERYFQKDTEGKSEESREFRVRQWTSVASRKVLEDIRIVETWVDQRQKTTYALAVIDREHEMAILREKISSLDQEISAYQKPSAEPSDSLEAIQAIHHARKLLLQREVYNADYRIMNRLGQGIESPVSLSNLQQSLQNILSTRFHIRAEVEGPYPDRIRSALIEGLSHEGFSVQSGPDIPEEIDLLIQGVVTLEMSEAPPWKFIRWTLRIDLTDSRKGKIIGSLIRNGKEGHLTIAQAEEKAVLKIRNEFAGALGDQITGYIYGDPAASP